MSLRPQTPSFEGETSIITIVTSRIAYPVLHWHNSNKCTEVAALKCSFNAGVVAAPLGTTFILRGDNHYCNCNIWCNSKRSTDVVAPFGTTFICKGNINYRGTSQIRNSASLGPYSRTMPRDLWWP